MMNQCIIEKVYNFFKLTNIFKADWEMLWILLKFNDQSGFELVELILIIPIQKKSMNIGNNIIKKT